MSLARMSANLSQDDASQFFRLMWALQAYVNRQLKLVPNIESAEDYATLDTEAKLKVREALWAQDELLDAFVTDNPAALPPEELDIIHSWKRRVAGDFYILRFLKRYAVFLSAGRDERVYGVVGLFDSLENVLPAQPLPIRTAAVLLPFKGRIVYDGLLNTYSIMFGPGIRGDLNEIYQRAKQAGKIIESLKPGGSIARPTKAAKPRRDWGPALDNLVKTADEMRQAETVVQTRALGVLKASAHLAQAAAHDPEDLEALHQLGRRVATALRQLETALDRAEYSG